MSTRDSRIFPSYWLGFWHWAWFGLGALFALAACPGQETAATSDHDAGNADAAPHAPVDAGMTDAAPPSIGAEALSLELKRSIAVRMSPKESSELYGTIAAGTRVGWKQVLKGADCEKQWVEITPFGWICETYLRPSDREPSGVEVPRLEPEELVPGVYGKVIGEEPKTYILKNDNTLAESRALSGSVMVRRYGELTIEETTYWLIDKGKREYLAADAIREFRPSEFRGVRLGDDTGLSLPLGFPIGSPRITQSVPVYRTAQGGAAIGKLRSRTPTPIFEIATGPSGAASAYRIGDGRWVKASDMLVAEKTQPPPFTEATERWLDIDLDRQVLVAYEGDLPVYATLISTGAKLTPTETGIYRIWIKFAETDMSDLAGEDPYSVATVPWTQFYAKDLALHTAYWHDTFGTRRSHGCTNLSPTDARFLYFWTDPQVPHGWSMAKGTIEHPGSLIRIRSKADPNPAFQGYAARIHEARAAAAQRNAVQP